MKRFLLSSCSALTLFSVAPVYAADISADSHLTAATVYTGRATLTRRAVVNLPAGAHTVIFSHLSAGLMPDSLRAEGSAAAKVTFGALTNRLVAGADLVAPREKELNDAFLILEDQRKTIEAEKQALIDKRTFLTTIAQQAALRTQDSIAEVNLKPEQWVAAAKSIHDETAETLKGLLAQDIALRDIAKKTEMIQQELAQLQTGQKNTYEIALPLDVSEATQLTIDLSYQITDATWVPLYDARLDTKTGKLDLIQYGSITQNSGEDWTNIELTLSTAQPQRGTGLPDLTPLWLSLYEPQNYGGLMDSKSVGAARMNQAMEMDSLAAAPPAAMQAENSIALKKTKAEFAVAAIDTGGFVSEYKIPGPSMVKADGTQSKLMIGTFDSDNKMHIQIKPQISTDAYLVANTTLKGDAPVLPGTVNLFRDGAYVGQSNLPLLRPGEDQDLAFGIDDQVSVKRKILKDERSKAGVINRDTVIERHMITEVQNLHKTAIDVSVIETVPTSQNEKIHTEIQDDKTTAGYAEDVKNIKGLLNWSLHLEPKQKSDVKLGWKVSWPQDKNLLGL